MGRVVIKGNSRKNTKGKERRVGMDTVPTPKRTVKKCVSIVKLAVEPQLWLEHLTKHDQSGREVAQSLADNDQTAV